ncbi:MAG: hypothetical protein H7244_09085 [Herminiimonas sp.]|nr:hypothetical protein [Herminiimonas sp.]
MQPATPSPQFHIAFYKFATVAAPDDLAASLRQLTAGLLGSILVAEEGINGVLAGSAEALDAFEAAVTAAGYVGGIFTGMQFKRSGCKTAPFGRMKVHRKDEIVALGVIGVTGVDTARRGGIDVTPEQWRALLADDSVVVIDNRNSFEFRLGRFKSAIDPQVDNFRDFSAYIAANAPAWQAAGKRVAMYCTGGIRCEKTSAWMQDAGIDVYQLEGGILNYFQSMPDAAHDWEGECFVFDNRIALDTRLEETGTTAEQVYDDPADAWRLARARRLDGAGDA